MPAKTLRGIKCFTTLMNVMNFHIHQAGLSTTVPKVSTIGNPSETRSMCHGALPENRAACYETTSQQEQPICCLRTARCYYWWASTAGCSLLPTGYWLMLYAMITHCDKHRPRYFYANESLQSCGATRSSVEYRRMVFGSRNSAILQSCGVVRSTAK